MHSVFLLLPKGVCFFVSIERLYVDLFSGYLRKLDKATHGRLYFVGKNPVFCVRGWTKIEKIR